MKKLRLNSNGFTVIELLVFIVVLATVTVLAVSNIRDLRTQNRDQESKVDVNAIFYQLEVFHEKNGNYPETINLENLKGLEEGSLQDKNGLTVNEEGSAYTYRPIGCSEAKCESFTLSTELEREAPFIKQSLNQ